MSERSVHVVPNKTQKGWSVKKSGALRESVNVETKAEAIKLGRIISQRSGASLVVHGKDGKIEKR